MYRDYLRFSLGDIKENELEKLLIKVSLWMQVFLVLRCLWVFISKFECFIICYVVVMRICYIAVEKWFVK